MTNQLVDLQVSVISHFDFMQRMGLYIGLLKFCRRLTR
jgi:hypothetical protein